MKDSLKKRLMGKTVYKVLCVLPDGSNGAPGGACRESGIDGTTYAE